MIKVHRERWIQSVCERERQTQRGGRGQQKWEKRWEEVRESQGEKQFFLFVCLFVKCHQWVSFEINRKTDREREMGDKERQGESY